MIILPEADAKGMLSRIEDLEAQQGNAKTFFQTLNIICGKCKITRGGFRANIGSQESALDAGWQFADDYPGQLKFEDFAGIHDASATIGAFVNDAYAYDSIWGRYAVVGTTTGDHQQATLSLTAGYQGETGYAMHPGVSSPTDAYRFSGIEVHAAAATGWVALDSVKDVFIYSRNDGHIYLLPNYQGNAGGDDLGTVVISRKTQNVAYNDWLSFSDSWSFEINNPNTALHAGMYANAAVDIKWHMKHADRHWSIRVDGTADSFVIKDETGTTDRLTIASDGTFTFTGTFNWTGNFDVTGTLDVSGLATFDSDLRTGGGLYIGDAAGDPDDNDLHMDGSINKSTNLGARVYRSTNQTITTATATAISFSHERWDDDTCWAAGDPTKVYAKHAGKHIITATVRFASNATGYRLIYIKKNGTTYFAAQKQTAINGSASMMTCAAILNLAANDYVELIVYQNSGGDLDVTSTSSYSPELTIARIP